MKNPLDPRHQKREKIMAAIFAWDFKSHKIPSRSNNLDIFKNLTKIDNLITKSAPQWPISKIAKVDLAVLRLAVYELAIQKKEPPKVIIDEAVELSKKYGSDSSAGFINGVLGTIYAKITKI